MLARPPTGEGRHAEEDDIVLLHDVTWEDYQRHLEARGDHSAPRIAYLEGVLEIMSPSRPHEGIKSTIGRLVEVWCVERDVEFSVYGAWTVQKKKVRRGVEPDECYVFGAVPDPAGPDLAIEVAWTSGGLDKLEIYRKLDVREVWSWRRRTRRLMVHALRGEQYQDVAASEVLPGIDVEELSRYLDRPTTSQAMREYRAALRQRR